MVDLFEELFFVARGPGGELDEAERDVADGTVGFLEDNLGIVLCLFGVHKIK